MEGETLWEKSTLNQYLSLGWKITEIVLVVANKLKRSEEK